MSSFNVKISMNRDLENDGIECTIILTSANFSTYTLHFSQENNFELWFNHVINLPGTEFDNKNTFTCYYDHLNDWFDLTTKLHFGSDTFTYSTENGDLFIYYFETDDEYVSYVNANFDMYYERDVVLPMC